MTSIRIALLLAALSAPTAVGGAQNNAQWIGTWACSQQVPEPTNALPASELMDATLREVVHVSAGGSAVRVRFSNAFGTGPLVIISAHLAMPDPAHPGATLPGTDRALSFAGRPEVAIPPGADFWSDPLQQTVAPLSDLGVSLYLANAPSAQTSHPGSRATSFLTHGDQAAATVLESPKRVEHWFFLSGVEVSADGPAGSIVVLGDSITDGHGATTDANNRWPDLLARRLQAFGKQGRATGVLNEGIGGNHMLTDGLGPNVLARFDRDVLSQAGVRTVILLEGVNDLGALARNPGPVTPAMHMQLIAALEAAYGQVVLRAHEHGLRVIGATILPYTGSDYYHPWPANEADRTALNAWIRTPGHLDAVIDFDQVMADPHDRTRLLPAYDSGDHLHPSPAGYAVMANAVPLALLEP